MNIRSGDIKCKVGDLVLTYTADGDNPCLGMIVSIRSKLVHIEWYIKNHHKRVTASGKTMAQLQRKAYLEYREIDLGL